MSKEDRLYLRNVVRELLRGYVEVPPDTVIDMILDDLWIEFEVMYANDTRRPVSGNSNRGRT